MPKTDAEPWGAWHEQLAGQRARIREFGELDADRFNRRPTESTWSVGENLEHLSLTLGPYLGAMERTIEEARASGLEASGPWKRGWFVDRFAKAMEPPVKTRFRTFRSLVPERTLDTRHVVDQLLRLTGDLAATIDAMRGIDLGRAKFRSPLLPLIRFDLGTAVDLNLGHNRRHLWAADQVLDRLGD